jgi:acetyl esterase/lipase
MEVKKSNKINRNIVTNSMVFILLLLAVCFIVQSRFVAVGDDPLLFPVNDYTEETLTYGSTTVTYHLYRHIAYVANPVDLDYQSLDVGVPIAINGTAYDATNAPIILVAINGGYMASSNLATGTSKLAGFSANNARVAMASGYVVVCPGLRGWNLETDGTYYGKAPAGQVDLKAAVRYIRYNDGVMPGNSEWIVVTGQSGGGAQSALLGVSGNSPLYDAALAEIGAADATDEIYASAPYCPITDLDHADMAYEWEFGTTPVGTELVNQTISQQLKDAFSVYQASLNIQGKNGFGTITAENYGDYLVETYLIPSANEYLNAMTEEDRDSYLSSRTWITWSDGSASFTFEDYVAYVGRSKGAPAFDAFDLSAFENSLFGNSTTDARHFTDFSLQQDSGDPSAEIDSELQAIVNMMNPMYFIQQNNTDCAQYWFIRVGARDRDGSHTMVGNLATILENNGKAVNASMYWDGGHAVNMDPDAFVEWVSQITDYPIVPEGLPLGVMLLLSAIAVIVSIRYYRKRPKWQNW